MAFPLSFLKIRSKRVHFIGIGGIGMSSLARWFLAQNWVVSGSDLVSGEITQELKEDGISVKIGQKSPKIPKNTSLFIHSQAIPPLNPEFKEASRRVEKEGAILLSYPEALGLLLKEYSAIAVSGSHGKSTTTSLLSLALARGKLNPTVIVGTKLKEFGGKNFRKGNGPYLVVEADEFHASFLNYFPTLAVILNIDREHLDWYKNLSNIKKAFIEFAGNVKKNGSLILNKDDKTLFSIKRNISAISKRNQLKTVWFSLGDPSARVVERAVSHLPGRHMASNALAAYHAALLLGVKKEDILRAFKNYDGAWRRMEYKGKFRIFSQDGRMFQVETYDDYAHHPTEIKSTLSGAKEFFKNKNIICVFQPHQTKRLKALFAEFSRAFDSADALFLCPVYKVAGRDESEKKYTSSALFNKIQKRKRRLLSLYIKNPGFIKTAIKELHKKRALPHPDSVLIMMGAGNINEWTKSLIL